MKKNYFIKLFLTIVIGLGCSIANAQDPVDLSSIFTDARFTHFVSCEGTNCTEEGDYVSYDDVNNKIIYAYPDDKDYFGSGGWDFGTPVDLSAYFAIQLNITKSVAGEWELMIKYKDVAELQKSTMKGGANVVVAILNAEHSNAVEYVSIKSNKSNEITIVNVRGYEQLENPATIPFSYLYGWETGWAEPNASWNATTQTVTFATANPDHFGWAPDGRLDFNGYDYVVLEFDRDASTIGSVVLDIRYNTTSHGGAQAGVPQLSFPSATSNFVALKLNKDYRYIRNLIIRPTATAGVTFPADLKLKKAYFGKGDCPTQPEEFALEENQEPLYFITDRPFTNWQHYSTFEEATKILNFTGSATYGDEGDGSQRGGWSWRAAEGPDYTAYDYVVLTFDPANSDESLGKIWLELRYSYLPGDPDSSENGDRGIRQMSAQVDVSAGQVAIALDGNYSVNVRNILIHAESAGNLKLINAYLAKSETFEWNGSASADWNDNDNWTKASNYYASTVRGEFDKAVIKKVSTNYPAIPAGTTLNSITIKAGAEIKNQQNLTVLGNGAIVEYNLTPGLNMIAAPMTTSVDNFAPVTAVKTFASVGNIAGWNAVAEGRSFMPGDGFAFETETATKVAIQGNLAKSYVFKSLFKDNDAFDFVLAGNPFMSSIDFNELSKSIAIGNSYMVWAETATAAGYAGYNATEGAYGFIPTVALTENIAPLQSFIVEEGEDDYELTFDIRELQTIGAGSGASANVNNKINITASNNVASVLTFIAKRENGLDSRKLFAEINEVPDVYTIKEGIELGANIIDTDNVVIPIGLATTYNGEMSLTLAGMDKYNANISFIDGDDVIDITKMATYTHTFSYVPAVEGGKTVASENRFSIELSPDGSGINTQSVAKASVYSKNGVVYVTGSSSNLIKQVAVYNAQGQIIYANDQVNAASYTIDGIAANLYIVKVVTENGIQNVKLINK